MDMEETEIKESKEDDILKERKEKFLQFVKIKSTWIFYAILAIILWVNYWLRTLPVPKLKDVTTGGYTIGPDLDPFLFLRYAKYIVEHGSLMAIDKMRYVPLGFNTAYETKLLPYMIAYFYKFLSLFSNVSVEYSAVIFPAFISIFTAIAFFLLVRKVFEEKGEKMSNITALVATAFLIVLPSLLPRTIAGIPEKESVGFFFLFLGLYFFVSGWQAKKLKNSIILGILAGITTAAMALVWGGFVYLFTTIAIATFAGFIFNKIGKKQFFMYTSWLFFAILLMTSFSAKFHFSGLAISTSTGLNFAVFVVLLVNFVLYKTRIKDTNFGLKIRKIKLPENLVSILISVLIILIFVVILLGPMFIFNFVGDIMGHLTTPYTDRLSFTVAENRQPFFSSEWKDSFGPVVQGVPLFFWLFFVGSILLFYEMVKDLEKKKKWIVVIAYIIFLFALIFSKYAPGVLDGTSTISKLVYFGGILIFFLGFIYIYYLYYKENKLEDLTKINFSYLFLISYFVISLMAARSAIRLIMGLSTAAWMGTTYFFR